MEGGGGIPDDEISLSVLFCVWGFNFVMLGLSHLVAVGTVSRARVGALRWEKDALFGDFGVLAVRIN
jgi:hypothetical protein